MQDSEVNFLRWTYQNRVQSLQNPTTGKHRSFAGNTCPLLAQGQKKDKTNPQGQCLSSLHRNQERQRERRIHTPTMPGTPRPGACVWPSRTRRLMRADPTQLRLASERQRKPIKNYMSLTQCHGQPEEATKAAEGSAPGHPQPIFHKVKKIRGRTHLGMCRRTSLTSQHQSSSKHRNDSSQKHTSEPVKAATACLQVPARKHLKKPSQTGVQVTQHWRFIWR